MRVPRSICASLLSLLLGGAVALGQSLTIQSVTPISGPVGTEVVIQGTGFDPIISGNTVFFGVVGASVHAASPTQLKVTVPAGASYEPITVVSRGLSATSPRPFDISFVSDQPLSANSFGASKLASGLGECGYLTLGDLNGDGKADLVMSSAPTADVQIWKNTSTMGTIAFELAMTVRPSWGGATPVIADVDCDGHPDLLVANYSAYTVSVYRNAGAAGQFGFDPPVDFQTGVTLVHLNTVDIDRDGKPEMVAYEGDSRTLSVFRNTSVPGRIDASSFAPRISLPIITSGSEVSAGDIDGDGLPDLACGNTHADILSVFRNTSQPGTIAFSQDGRIDIPTGDGPYGVSLIDLDLDGKIDAVVANHYENTLSIYRNTATPGSIGPQSFAAPFKLPTGNSPVFSRPADFDGDGKVDLVVTDMGEGSPSSLTIYRNQSTPGSLGVSSFSDAISIPLTPYPFTLGVADLDGDGRPDIALQKVPQGAFEFFRNIPTGPGSIRGLVTSGGVGMDRVTVKLLDSQGLPISSFDPVLTSAGGRYAFTNLEAGEYQVMIVEPLGYVIEQSTKPATVLPGSTTTVDFDLTRIATSNNARGKGYWKHQFDVQVLGRGTAQESASKLNGYIQEVHSHYTYHWGTFAGYTSFEQWQAVLSNRWSETMLDRAKQHLATLVLNVASLKIGQLTVVTEDGRTAADVMTYASQLVLDDDAANDELAKDLAESVNNQMMIGGGIVPVGGILYRADGWSNVKGSVPESYELVGSYPNPFNPATKIRFGLPEPTHVTLKVFDVLGREVVTLVNAGVEAGYHDVVFDARNLPSGVYVCQLQAGAFVQSVKTLLVK